MTQTIHPSLGVAEVVHLLQRARHGDIVEVTGLHSLDHVQWVQGCADAAETAVWWSHNRNGHTACLLIDRGET